VTVGSGVKGTIHKRSCPYSQETVDGVSIGLFSRKGRMDVKEEGAREPKEEEETE
jgi:hypothetical protein